MDNMDYIKTADFSATPIYNYVNKKRVFDKYEVSNTIIVHTKNIDKAGEIIDKAIAAGAVYDGDFWDYYEGKTVDKALPIGTVLTISAAGSEGSGDSVITKEKGMFKRATTGEALRPKFSILDPALTQTLPAYQTACGITDILAHLYERYLTNTKDVEVTDRMIEALMLTMIKEGLPINVQYVLVADRIVQTQEDLDYVEWIANNSYDKDGNKVDPFQTYARPGLGDVLYKDMDGSGVIDQDDRVPLGHGDTPRFLYNITLGCEWKGFDFSTVLSGTGNQKVQYMAMRSSSITYGNQISKEIADGRWYEGRTTPAKYPRLLINDSRNTQNSTIWETDKRFFKIRNIQLGYSLPKKWVQAASLSRVRVFCSLENFFTFTSFTGLDPETTKLTYPTIRQASFGLNVSF